MMKKKTRINNGFSIEISRMRPVSPKFLTCTVHVYKLEETISEFLKFLICNVLTLITHRTKNPNIYLDFWNCTWRKKYGVCTIMWIDLVTMYRLTVYVASRLWKSLSPYSCPTKFKGKTNSYKGVIHKSRGQLRGRGVSQMTI